MSDSPTRVASASRFPILRRVFRIPDGIGDDHLRLLLAVALALLFEEYDLAMLTSALGYISADLGIESSVLPLYLGLIRLGALPAFALIPFADRLGRRRVFLASLVAMGMLTFLTAFAQNAWQFVLLQMITRTFFVAGSAVAFVFVTEEFPARYRGWGIGMLGALAATGHGLAAGIFSQIEVLPFGWRALYAVGIVPVLLFPVFRKRIPETKRFEAHKKALGDAESGGLFGWIDPLRGLWKRTPVRAVGIALSGLLPSFGIVATFQYTGIFTQQNLGWEPGEYSLMVIVGGGIGIIGNIVAGQLGDRLGRRVVGATMLAVFPLFVALFYVGPRSGLPAFVVPLAWVGFVFTSQGGRVILRALATELFPTSYRGAASGLFSILDAVGSAAGLFTQFVMAGDDIWRTIPIIATATIAGGVIVWLFPETKQRELEAIAH